MKMYLCPFALRHTAEMRHDLAFPWNSFVIFIMSTHNLNENERERERERENSLRKIP